MTEPYKMTVTVRMMDGTEQVFLINSGRGVRIIWKALRKIWELPKL